MAGTNALAGTNTIANAADNAWFRGVAQRRE
jgi:hypothetical protein